MKIEHLKALIREEYDSMNKEVEAQAEQIAKDLEALRKKLKGEMSAKTHQMGFEPKIGAVKWKTLPLNTVADLLDIKVNDLTLYLLNCVKTANGRQKIEFHLGEVYFYEDEK